MSWPVVALGDICELKYGKSLAASVRQDGPFPVMGSNGVVGSHNSAITAGPTVVIGRKGSIGAVAYTGGPSWPIDTTYFVDASTTAQDLRWLYWRLASLGLEKMNKSAAVPGLNRDDAYRVTFPLPPLPEQRRIASILDEAELLQLTAIRSIDGLNGLAGSIYSQLFETPGASGRAFPASLLGTIGTLERGVSRARPRNRPDLLAGVHPLVQTGDIANADGYVSSHRQTYSDAGLAQSRMWPAGTLAITIAANIAKTAILTYPACFPDSVVGFTPKGGIQSEYVRFWLRGVQKTLELQAPSSAQKNINLEILRGLRIPIPPDSLQLHFVESIHRIEKLKEKARSRSAKFDELFASLQYRAFRGEL